MAYGKRQRNTRNVCKYRTMMPIVIIFPWSFVIPNPQKLTVRPFLTRSLTPLSRSIPFLDPGTFKYEWNRDENLSTFYVFKSFFFFDLISDFYYNSFILLFLFDITTKRIRLYITFCLQYTYTISYWVFNRRINSRPFSIGEFFNNIFNI